MPGDTTALTSHARIVRSLAHLLLGLSVLAGWFVAVPASSAEAAWAPAGPTGQYVPSRVWQMKKNCVWAAGAMLLDKWTRGGVRVSQTALRRASGKKRGGASLYDLSRGVARVAGIRMRFSPGYGDTMAWWQLLDRLASGGGAVLIGEYGRLPAHFTRWSRSFANRRNSSHAVYIQSYDRARGKVWLMDPLAEGHYPGEWIDVGALRRFATIDDGKVMAVATPARSRARHAPLTDHAYRLSGLRLTGAAVAGASVSVQVRLSIKWGFPTPAAHRFVAHWEPIAPPDQPNPGIGPRFVVDSARAPGAVPPENPVVVDTVSAPDRAGRRGFGATLPVPTIPGRYRLRLGLAEVGRKTPSRTFGSVVVEVLEPYSGAISLPTAAEVTAGATISVKLGLTNIGSVDWRTPEPVIDDRPQASRPQTLLVLSWRAKDGTELPAAQLPVELAPGQAVKLTLDLAAPDRAGAWTLVPDVVHLERGALSSTGNQLPTMSVTVNPRGLSAEP
jgi:hypothetical protein